MTDGALDVPEKKRLLVEVILSADNPLRMAEQLISYAERLREVQHIPPVSEFPRL